MPGWARSSWPAAGAADDSVGCSSGWGPPGALTVVTTSAAVLADEPTAPARLAVHLQSWLWVPAFVPLLTLVPLLYPDGRLVSRRWRRAVAASVLAMVLLATGTALYPQTFQGAVAIASRGRPSRSGASPSRSARRCCWSAPSWR